MKKIILCFINFAFLTLFTFIHSTSPALAAPKSVKKPQALAALNGEEESADSTEAEKSEGEFTLSMKKYDEPGYKELYAYLNKDGTFKKYVDFFNQTFVIPENLEIEFDKLPDGPHYFKKKISMSYDMFFLVQELFEKAYPKQDAETMREYNINTNSFFLFHELGHALIDIYHLPVVGDEETTADNLGAVFALDLLENGWDVVVDAADFFDLLRQAREEKQLESAYWDEHRMDSQRYYYILCLAYGKFPEETKKELQSYGDKDLQDFLKEKGSRCKLDYKESLDKWIELLKPHLRSSKDTENNKTENDEG